MSRRHQCRPSERSLRFHQPLRFYQGPIPARHSHRGRFPEVGARHRRHARRNTFGGLGSSRVDERFGSTLRLESYNSFNRVNLNSPPTDLTSNNFAQGHERGGGAFVHRQSAAAILSGG